MLYTTYKDKITKMVRLELINNLERRGFEEIENNETEGARGREGSSVEEGHLLLSRLCVK